MRSTTRIASKGRRRPKHNDTECQPARIARGKVLAAEAEELLARQAWLGRPEAQSLAFDLVLMGVPVTSIELDETCMHGVPYPCGICDN